MLGPLDTNPQELLASYFRPNGQAPRQNARRIVAPSKPTHKEHADAIGLRQNRQRLEHMTETLHNFHGRNHISK